MFRNKQHFFFEKYLVESTNLFTFATVKLFTLRKNIQDRA